MQGEATMRHDILKGLLRRAIHRAGVAPTLEPTLRRLPGLEAYGDTCSIQVAGLEARGHSLLALESGMSWTCPSGTPQVRQTGRRWQRGMEQWRRVGIGRRGGRTAG
jgi:hypothetical protein